MRLKIKTGQWLLAAILLLACLILTCGLGSSAALAAPPTSAAKPAALPDYGSRDSLTVQPAADTGDAQALNPLSQIGRAFEALVVVLAAVVGVLYLLKRSGFVKGDLAVPGALRSQFSGAVQKLLRAGTPPQKSAETSSLLTIQHSQALPGTGGATLHLVVVAGRTLLLGAAGQGVNLISEWESELEKPAEIEPAAFDEYLQRIGIAPPVSQSHSSVRAAESRVGSAADRLQSLISRRSDEATGGKVSDIS